jgi:hypothetical protein
MGKVYWRNKRLEALSSKRRLFVYKMQALSFI